MSVCVSRTICVCTGEKWFRTFVRGTVRTENEIVSVCVSLSSTICVYRTAKWFNPFVRGTFETDSQYNLEKRTATVLRFYLHFSNVRPQPFYTFPMLGPLGAAPARLGWTATVLRFQMLLVPDVRQSNAATNFQFCLSPTMRLSRRHSILSTILKEFQIAKPSEPAKLSRQYQESSTFFFLVWFCFRFYLFHKLQRYWKGGA